MPPLPDEFDVIECAMCLDRLVFQLAAFNAAVLLEHLATQVQLHGLVCLVVRVRTLEILELAEASSGE